MIILRNLRYFLARGIPDDASVIATIPAAEAYRPVAAGACRYIKT